METLRGVFPSVPTEALLSVLEICDQSVAVASAWLLENDWQELMDNAEAQQDEEVEVVPPPTNVNNTNATDQEQERAQPSTTLQDRNVAEGATRWENTTRGYARRSVTNYLPLEEEFDSEEDNEGEEEENEDEDEEDMDYDPEDEAAFRLRGMPLPSKRVKIAKSKERGELKPDDFWVAFDGQVVAKSMIELLNTTLSKLAHSEVVLLNRQARGLDEAAATAKLKSIVAPNETIKVQDGHLQSLRDAGKRIAVASLLNGGNHTSGKETGRSPSSLKTPPNAAAVGQKRKRIGEVDTEDSPRQGFFAYFFPVKELDMVWRTVMHAHVFKGRFGEKIEFHTAAGGSFSRRDFDELMHIQNSATSSRAASLGFSPLSTLKCCLILPCVANKEEMFRVGKNIHSMLKVQGSLYYQVVDTNAATPRSDHFELQSEDEKLTEERFRQFARYRVKEKEEETTTTETKVEPSTIGVDPYMSYQQQHKVTYCLEALGASKWARFAD